ncbi:hypothetical protein EZV62_011814 [Acer yangbiense]|uniref:Dirigent protein n=1 Tax=Acer yangbiense TaxID=1000413 RepID=A0A5C7I6B8_9ROSI|nr:hypothetical protein EZV62_011814 [Acer yangbiense]
MVMMADDPLTETLDSKSKLVGRAQGLYGSASQAELGLIMVNFGFTDDVDRRQDWHFPAGTGIAISQTHWFDPASGDAIVGYNVTIVH